MTTLYHDAVAEQRAKAMELVCLGGTIEAHKAKTLREKADERRERQHPWWMPRLWRLGQK